VEAAPSKKRAFHNTIGYAKAVRPVHTVRGIQTVRSEHTVCGIRTVRPEHTVRGVTNSINSGTGTLNKRAKPNQLAVLITRI
jgi:hypothetical protein